MWWFFGCSAWLLPGSDKAHLEALFHTGWFVESLLTQTLIVHIIRTDRIPFIQSRASLAMTMATLSVMLVAVALPYLPFAGFFGFVPLPPVFWAWIGAFLLLYGVLAHFVKSKFAVRAAGIKGGRS
jgi:Mg2+-importing ATPase